LHLPFPYSNFTFGRLNERNLFPFQVIKALFFRVPRLLTWLFVLLAIPMAAQSYPVVLANGYVLVRGELDGQCLDILLDSGSPGLVINSRHYEGASSYAECIGVNGPYPCATVSVGGFSWLGIRHKRQEAILSDLGFLEAATGRRIDALAGLSLLDGHRIRFNFDEALVIVDPVVPAEAPTLRFHYDGHLPVITCSVNGRNARLGLDTGARHNHLFRAFKSSDDDPAASASGRVIVVGTDNAGQDRRTSFAMLRLSKNGEPLPTAFAYRPEEQAANPFAIDGLLGQEFLTSYNLVLDPARQQLWLLPRSGMPALASILMP